MLTSVRWRLIWIGVLLAMCTWALVPKENELGERVSPLNLGLDLQGGMHLAVEIVDPDGTLTEDTQADAVERTLTTIRNRIDQFGVREPTIQRVGDRIVVELAGAFDPDRAKAIVAQTAFMEFKIVTDGQSFIQALERIDAAIVNEVGVENLDTSPLDTAPEVDLGQILGATEDSASVDSLAADVPSGETATDSVETGVVPDPATLRVLTALLSPGRIPGEFLVTSQDQPMVEGWLEFEGVQQLIPRNVTLHWGAEDIGAGGNTYTPLYVLELEPLITGDLLEDAGPANRDPTFNQPIVPFQTTRLGARVFERGTARNINNNMIMI